jgi:hypothetical protein
MSDEKTRLRIEFQQKLKERELFLEQQRHQKLLAEIQRQEYLEKVKEQDFLISQYWMTDDKEAKREFLKKAKMIRTEFIE